jgi:hypothetical protein
MRVKDQYAEYEAEWDPNDKTWTLHPTPENAAMAPIVLQGEESIYAFELVETGDRKDVSGKHSPSLMPIEADRAYSAVSDYGLAKYGNRYTWKENDPDEGIRKYLDAAIRHAKAHLQIREIDPESGLPHVYAVVWNAAAAVWHYERRRKE